jgi:plastocyanin
VTRRAFAVALTGAVALAAAAPGAAPAHPGHGTVTINIAHLAYTPATVNVVEGDLVAWTWGGPETNYSVTTNPGQGESFDSDAGRSAAQVNHSVGDAFTYYFAKAGTYTYYCKVHPFMHGSVVVAPYNGPSRTITTPRIAALHAVVAAHKKLKITFLLSEKAGMSVQLQRVHSKRVARRGFKFEPRGKGSLTVSLKGLKAGTYTLTARAQNSGGISSKKAHATFKLKAG